MNDDLEFKIGEDEKPATVSIGEDGEAEIMDKQQPLRLRLLRSKPAMANLQVVNLTSTARV